MSSELADIAAANGVRDLRLLDAMRDLPRPSSFRLHKRTSPGGMSRSRSGMTR